jgi:NMT1/THI5 like
MEHLRLTHSSQSSRVRDSVATHWNRVVIPNECEGSKISPCGRNDRKANGGDVFDSATQSVKREDVSAASRSIISWLIAALLALVPHGSDAQPREKVRVALGSISVNTSVIPVGHQYGVFAKYGVDLEPIYMGGGMNSLAAVTSNTVQFLSAGSTATISARLGGIDIVMLTVQSNKLDYSVFAAPEIKSPQDLKGKIVTGTRPGASADSAAIVSA